MNFKEVDRGGTDLPSGALELPIKVFPEKPSDDPRDIPCVRLNADQVVEITADDYSLKIFNLTRIKPLTIQQIVEKEPEPEAGDAIETIRRFIDVELVAELPEGYYYSKYPENYVNFTNHPYDEEFEADKDARIFKLMKLMAGDKNFWKTNAYFSEDGYFTEEQTMHIKKCLQDIKFYIKKVVQENNKKGSLEGLKFRRHKFYDLTLPLLALIFTAIVAVLPQVSFAGNDPGSPGFAGGRNNWSINPLTVAEIQESIDWSKQTFWQDYMANGIVFDSNDPGRSVNNPIFAQAIENIANPDNVAQFLKMYEGGNGFSVAPQAKCSFQLERTYGDMKAVTLPCLGEVKFATESVCGVYGDPAYCNVAAKASELIKMYRKQ